MYFSLDYDRDDDGATGRSVVCQSRSPCHPFPPLSFRAFVACFLLCTVHVRLIFFSEKGTTLCSISHRKEESRNAWFTACHHIRPLFLTDGRTDGMQVLKEGGGKSTLFSTLEMLRETVDNLVDGCVQAVQAARGRRRSWGGGGSGSALFFRGVLLLCSPFAAPQHAM